MVALLALSNVESRSWSSGVNGGLLGWYGILPNVTVADVEAAADGDDESAQRIVHRLLEPTRSYPWAPPLSVLRVSGIAGPGSLHQDCELGWPIQWLTIGSETGYADVASRADPTSPPNWGLPPRQGWKLLFPTLSFTETTPNGPSKYVILKLDALATLLLGLACLAYLLIRPFRLRLRMRNSLILVLLALVLAAAGWPRFRSSAIARSSRLNAAPALLLARVRAMATTSQGRREIAEWLATGIQGTGAHAPIQADWFYDGSASITSSNVGWPTSWIHSSAALPNQPIPSGTLNEEWRLYWARNGLWLRTSDAFGKHQVIGLAVDGIVAGLLPAALLYAALPTLWYLGRGRRGRRWQREGRCFTCGYDVGLEPVERVRA